MIISNFLSRKQNSNDQAGGLSIPCKECGMKFTEQERLKNIKKLLIQVEEKEKSLLLLSNYRFYL